MTVFRVREKEKHDIRRRRLQDSNTGEDEVFEHPINDDQDHEDILTRHSATISRPKDCWYSITFPRAKLFPQSISEHCSRAKTSSISFDQLRQHIFAMGWKIEQKYNQKQEKVRYRYITQDGIYFYSLNMVCQHLKKTQGCTTKTQVISLQRLQEKQCNGSNCSSIESDSKIAPLLTLIKDQHIIRRKRSTSHMRKQDHSGNMNEEQGIGSNCSLARLTNNSVPLPSVVSENQGIRNNWSPSGGVKEAVECSNNVVGEVRHVENNLSSCVVNTSNMLVPMADIFQAEKINGESHGIIMCPLDYSRDVVVQEQFVEGNCSPVRSASEMSMSLQDIVEEGKSIGNNINYSSDKRITVSAQSSDLVEEKECTGNVCLPAVGNVNQMAVSSLGVGQKEQCVGFNCSMSSKNMQALKSSRSTVEEKKGNESDKRTRLQCSDDVFVERECCPQAVIDYCKVESMTRNGKQADLDVHIRQLILKAKMHLSFEGWKFCYVFKGERRELRFCSPEGKQFCSLITACRAWLKNETVAGSFHGLRDNLDSDQFPHAISNESEESYIGLTSSKELIHHQINSCLDERGSLDELPVASKKRCTVDKSIYSQKLKKPKASCIPFNRGSVLHESDPKNVLKLSKRPAERNAILSLLIDNGVVLPGHEVSYVNKKDCHPMAKGKITHEGIECYCCGKVYGLSKFEVHAGSTCRRPAANIFLQDGRSLHDCQLQLVSDESNDACSVCCDGGNLVLCESCPSAFHSSCIGLEDIPEGEWFCPSCRCGICGQGEFNGDCEQYTEKTVIYCYQCKREYHVGCLRERELAELKRCPKGNWFCSRKCLKIFSCLQELVGKTNPVGVEGLTCTILGPMEENSHSVGTSSADSTTKHHKKLFAARRLLYECFDKLIDPRNNREIITDVLFNKESDLNQTSYSGFHTILLEKENEVISVATIRIFNEKVAEMPLIGTSSKYRRRGMCRLLISELQKILCTLGVERLLLPSVPAVLKTWTNSFGFTKMTRPERLQFLQHTFLEFEGTILCQKLLMTSNKRAGG